MSKRESIWLAVLLTCWCIAAAFAAFGQALTPTTLPTTQAVDNFAAAKMAVDRAAQDYTQVIRQRDALIEELARRPLPALVTTQPTTQPVSHKFVKGLNLGKHTEASGAQPFQNLFVGFVGGGSDRTSVGWGKPDKPWERNNALPLTDRGYPLADASAYSYLDCAPAGLYDFSYDGTCEVSFGGKLSYAEPLLATQPATKPAVGVTRPPRLVLLTQDGRATMGTVTVRSPLWADPPRNFKLVPHGQDAGRVYSPHWLMRLREGGTRVVRPMDWQVVNRQRLHQWPDRLRGDDWRQVGPMGVSHDLLAALCREGGFDLHLNVPVFYTDLSCEQEAEWYRSALPAGSTAYVEISNELWNASFDDSQRVRDWAKARGVQFHEAYAQECVRIALAFQRGWQRGSNDVRLCLLLPCQTGSPSLTREVFKAIRKQEGKGAKELGFTHVAVSGYFSYDPALDLNLEKLEQEGQPDEAVTAYFGYLMQDTSAPQQRRLDQKKAWESEGLLPYVYEGGLGDTFYNTKLRRNAAEATKRVARRDPRFGAFVRACLAACERDYGPLPPDTPFCWYDFIEADAWGLLDDRNDVSPKFSAWSLYGSGE